jgi:hypothetical protein
MAHDYKRRRDISMVSLLHESGHKQEMGELSVDELAECLRAHPDWQEAWMLNSDDQRIDRGWWIAPHPAGGCILGQIEGDERVHFDDCTRGCAEFVRLQMQELAAWTFLGMLRDTVRWFAAELRANLGRRRRK